MSDHIEETPTTASERGRNASIARWGKLSALPPHERFWSKVTKGADSECWIWNGRLNVKGYGQWRMWGSATTTAHRHAWNFTNGKAPDELDVAHRCHNRRCVNPAHLYLATRSENMKDSARCGRLPLQLNPTKSNLRKLSPLQVAQIRDSNESVKALRVRFSVCAETIRSIKTRKTWKQIQ